MKEHFIQYQQFSLEYQKFGSGPKILICFTGFGSSSIEMGESLMQTDLAEHYTFYCFYYFFHGHSKYPANRIDRKQINKIEFSEIINNFLDQNSISKVDVLGYSLGGKLAIDLLEEIPDKIESVFLLAPDGLKKIWWYKWVAKFPPFLMVYKYYIKKPYWYYWWIRTIGKMGFIHQKSVDFAIEQMNTQEKRQRVYDVWMSLLNLETQPNRLKSIANLNERLHLFLGKYDKVIRKSNGYVFCKNSGLHPKTNMHLLEFGHSLLKPEPLKKIAAIILTNR